MVTGVGSCTVPLPVAGCRLRYTSVRAASKCITLNPNIKSAHPDARTVLKLDHGVLELLKSIRRQTTSAQDSRRHMYAVEYECDGQLTSKPPPATARGISNELQHLVVNLRDAMRVLFQAISVNS